MLSRIARLLFAVVACGTFSLAGGYAIAQSPCNDCHETDTEHFEASVHGSFDCTDCHAELGDDHPMEPPPPVACDTCHDDIAAEYLASVHGQARAEGLDGPPACQTCHGEIHTLVPSDDPDSLIYNGRLAETCGGCHADPEMVARFGIPVARPLHAYRASVHSRAVAAGQRGATCSDCHASHGVFPGSDPRSTVSHRVVPETCGQCHAEITAAYRESVHGRAMEQGAREAPVCTDCHGEHRILSPRETDSPVFASNVPKMTCGRCHSDLRIADKYGLAGDQVSAYEDSYHGLAISAGAPTVAHCGSCHGVHDVLPSSDPDSHVHADRLSETCGACHPRAGERFAIGKVHILPTDPEDSAVFWIRRLYLIMIFAVVGGMLLHNLLDLLHKVKSPPQRPVGLAGHDRMALGFRVAHALVAVSFAAAAWTGFALKYPEAWWARPLLGWETDFGFRGWAHRVAAIVMMAGLAVHLIHLAMSRSARSTIARMRPLGEDFHELVARLRYLVGLRKTPPPVPVLGYAEKIEYLALIWGLAVMAVTGFLLWWDDLVLRLLPKWVADVATVIHFYEAVLATLAILVWHLYFVIFDPVVYPVDPAWLTGKESPGRTAERRRD